MASFAAQPSFTPVTRQFLHDRCIADFGFQDTPLGLARRHAKHTQMPLFSKSLLLS